MISAGEALTIAREAHRFEIELEEIEPYIRNKAMDGEYSVTLYPSRQYSARTIEELRRFGYRVAVCINEERHHFSYCIVWGDEDE